MHTHVCMYMPLMCMLACMHAWALMAAGYSSPTERRAAFDTERWVGAFEEGVRSMVEVYRYGLKPMHVLQPARHLLGT